MGKTYEKVGKGRFFDEDTGGNDARPSFKGSCEISGTEFDIALWPRVSKGGHRYLHVAFSLKGQRDTVGKGSLFLRENTNPKAPSFSGPMEIGDRNFDAGVWPQTSKNTGKEYYSMKVELVTEEG